MNARVELITYLAFMSISGAFAAYWVVPATDLKPFATGGDGQADVLVLAGVALGFMVARWVTEPYRR